MKFLSWALLALFFIQAKLALGEQAVEDQATAVADALSLSLGAQEIPTPIQAPAEEHLLLQVHAKGDQIYGCKGEGGQFAWTLQGPDAKLFDKRGKPFGKHFAGPTWEANDGSRITGRSIANTPSPDANSIAWLLLKIVSHSGKGVLERVTSVQRINTNGGKAPAFGCDTSHEGQQVRVPYSADYLFYGPK
jgi:Protein of unknown function (DUF3455)